MTLIKRYAIEPAALRRWEDFRYVMEKMSFSEGKVVVTLPKKWIRDFLDSLGEIGDIERQRFVTKLQRYKEDRMIASGTPYFQESRWVDNALRAISEHRVEAILVSDLTISRDSSLSLPTPADIDEEFFSGAREIRCLNSAEGLLAPAKIFLESAFEAVFIDPYFKVTSPNSLLALNEFAKYSCEATHCSTFVIYTRFEFMPKGSLVNLRKYFEKYMSNSIGTGFRITVHFVSEETTRQSFHARYFLTQRGGLRYDKGFQVGNPPELVDISLLDKQLHSDLYSTYSDARPDLKITETLRWSRS